MAMRNMCTVATFVLMMPGLLTAEAGRQTKGVPSKAGWHTATASQLQAVLPLRAPVEKERIETEMSSATGVIDARGHVIAAVVLITAGYAANGKYSHYLLAQSSLRIGPDILLPAGTYVVGWTRAANGLFVHIYEATTGIERGTITAPIMQQPTTVVPIKIWPPSEGSFIQIGRFMLPYTPVE
jgi:hypothetical protein